MTLPQIPISWTLIVTGTLSPRLSPAPSGNPARSGKLRVAERVLDSWRAAGHKALLFCQTQQMLDIFEKLARSKKSPAWSYHRMDGGTPVASRSRLIDDFNNNPDVFLFLLTTKVGVLNLYI